MTTYNVQYFGCPTVINDSFECASAEDAAFRFNKKHFEYAYPGTLEKFKRLSDHLKYWGLEINGENWHEAALLQHKEKMKETFKKFTSLCKKAA